MHAQFISYTWENAARTVATFALQPDKPYFFTAGQYADITIPHNNPDRRGLTRTMSWTSSPNSKQLTFTTKFSAPGGSPMDSTYKQALLTLKPGDTVTLTDAMGDMVLPLATNTPLVFVAGGLGLASFVSMTRWLREQHDSRHITLLYAVRDVQDVLFQHDFATYATVGTLEQNLYTIDQKADAINWPGTIHNTRLTAEEIMKYAGDEAMVYISGSERMVEQLRTELEQDFKLPQYRLAFDYYDGYTDL